MKKDTNRTVAKTQKKLRVTKVAVRRLTPEEMRRAGGGNCIGPDHCIGTKPF
jgi:hypothetical protein